VCGASESGANLSTVVAGLEQKILARGVGLPSAKLRWRWMEEEPGPVSGQSEEGSPTWGRSGEPRLRQRPASHRRRGRRGAAEKEDQSAESRQRIECDCCRQVQTRERQRRVRGSAGGTGQPGQAAEEAAGQQRGQSRGERSEKDGRERDHSPRQTQGV